MQFSVYSFDELDTETLYEIIAHRMEVFVLGQGNIYRDLDGFDQKASHLLARDDAGALVGYVRLLPAALHYDGHAHNSFGRLSVKDCARGKGLGAELVRRACRRLAEDSQPPDGGHRGRQSDHHRVCHRHAGGTGLDQPGDCRSPGNFS